MAKIDLGRKLFYKKYLLSFTPFKKIKSLPVTI